ncbi:hypothetical protein DMB66_43905 [Actinoplanes sp. ATCC 53533]|uniref:TRADD-N-associated membrane domain-containing protein n=1 Tax=Actinoplanes sp. ATCC 53533 TaxID=1288362 RepID=UPI000F786A3E|nr:hypothetical protein [Actinoplanes sp. ATCC 53533]RSM49990.1 hypothetical protein DMB66_43905 [Actinoplanes sp. ATCC 53533]
MGVILLLSGPALLIIFRASDKSPDTITLLLPSFLGFALIALPLRKDSTYQIGDFSEDIRERVESEAPSYLFNVQEGGTVHFTPNEDDLATVRASHALEKQEAILREIYTQGLGQARRSFTVSLIFASLGALVLLSGIGLAIRNAETSGEQYASIVTGAVGVVINLTSSLFFVQSNRARRNMAEQGMMLREESREDRRLNAARELVAAIDDAALRSEVRAELARKLLNIGEASAASESQDGTDAAAQAQ